MKICSGLLCCQMYEKSLRCIDPASRPRTLTLFDHTIDYIRFFRGGAGGRAAAAILHSSAKFTRQCRRGTGLGEVPRMPARSRAKRWAIFNHEFVRLGP